MLNNPFNFVHEALNPGSAVFTVSPSLTLVDNVDDQMLHRTCQSNGTNSSPMSPYLPLLKKTTPETYKASPMTSNSTSTTKLAKRKR
jgi:hypothetical protein